MSLASFRATLAMTRVAPAVQMTTGSVLARFAGGLAELKVWFQTHKSHHRQVSLAAPDMVDPFSIVVGSASLADLCIRVGKLLKKAQEGFHKVDEELNELSQKIAALRAVSDLIRCSFETELLGTKDASDQQIIQSHWQTTHSILKSCETNVEKIAVLVTDVLGKEHEEHPKYSNLRKFLKHQWKEHVFAELKQRLRAYSAALQTSLAAINL